ncbi:MAG: hypothetical protein J0L93_11105 [Deltaproteobacteria bacterium]|nr:hypothetical protein [Deltaproteobacteria bacterium]
MEILAALFLFAVMTIGISSTMRETTILTRKVSSREATASSAIIATDRLQKDIQMTFNEPPISIFKLLEGGVGSEVTFSFLDTPIKTLFERRTAGLIMANYHLEKVDDGSYKLLRSEVPYYNYEKLRDAPSQIIAEGVLKFRIEAYDHRNDRWLKDWDNKGPNTNGYFPKAVRLLIETVDTSLPKDEWQKKSLTITTDFLILNEIETR